MKGKKHLLLIGFLGIIFFVLIFVSTSSASIKVEYEFKDVTIEYLPTYQNQILLGEVKIKNSGFVPKRVFLDRFVICQFSNSTQDETYIIEYKGNTQKSYSDVFSSPSRNLNFVEVSANQEIVLEIVPQIYRYNLQDKIKQHDLNGKEVPFYIFKIDETNRNLYNSCSSVDVQDAYQTINVKFDIDESDLKDEDLVYKD